MDDTSIIEISRDAVDEPDNLKREGLEFRVLHLLSPIYVRYMGIGAVAHNARLDGKLLIVLAKGRLVNLGSATRRSSL